MFSNECFIFTFNIEKYAFDSDDSVRDPSYQPEEKNYTSTTNTESETKRPEQIEEKQDQNSKTKKT